MLWRLSRIGMHIGLFLGWMAVDFWMDPPLLLSVFWSATIWVVICWESFTFFLGVVPRSIAKTYNKHRPRYLLITMGFDLLIGICSGEIIICRRQPAVARKSSVCKNIHGIDSHIKFWKLGWPTNEILKGVDPQMKFWKLGLSPNEVLKTVLSPKCMFENWIDSQMELKSGRFYKPKISALHQGTHLRLAGTSHVLYPHPRLLTQHSSLATYDVMHFLSRCLHGVPSHAYIRIYIYIYIYI